MIEQQPETQAKIIRDEYEEQKSKQKELLRKAELRKYPTLKKVFDRIKVNLTPHIKMAVLKRIHIILDFLKMPTIPDNMEPSLDYSLGLLGRSDMSLKLIEEIGKILGDAAGYSLLRSYPREIVQLRDHIRERYRLADELVRAITFQKIKEEGHYEQKAKVNTGAPVPDTRRDDMGL